MNLQQSPDQTPYVVAIVLGRWYETRGDERSFKKYVRIVKADREFSHRKGKLSDEDIEWLANKDRKLLDERERKWLDEVDSEDEG